MLHSFDSVYTIKTLNKHLQIAANKCNLAKLGLITDLHTNQLHKPDKNLEIFDIL
jgi:hypothetical protein